MLDSHRNVRYCSVAEQRKELAGHGVFFAIKMQDDRWFDVNMNLNTPPDAEQTRGAAWRD